MLRISNGNSKLKSSKDVKFLIWSISPIITCPNATDNCIKFCYANNSYRMYPNVRTAWDSNLEESKKDSFVDEMIEALETQFNRKGHRNAKKIIVRIHESGDFYSQEYADKWLTIAEHFKDNTKVKFMAYTKSVDFFMDRDIPNNMVVRFSLWDDTEPTEYAKAIAKGLPIYTAVEQFTNEPKKERCRCEDCGTCCKCWSALQMIKCEIH